MHYSSIVYRDKFADASFFLVYGAHIGRTKTVHARSKPYTYEADERVICSECLS